MAASGTTRSRPTRRSCSKSSSSPCSRRLAAQAQLHADGHVFQPVVDLRLAAAFRVALDPQDPGVGVDRDTLALSHPRLHAAAEDPAPARRLVLDALDEGVEG